MTYRIWDVETSIRTSYKRKGNPFDPTNFVVMSGYKAKDGRVVGEYFGRKPKPADWFTKLLEPVDGKPLMLLVGQNIKYDMLYAFCDAEHGEANRKAWYAFVARGGNVWDTQLAEYLLEGMDPASQMLSMDELAPRYGGNLKFDEVKAMWSAGISTEDIDPALLRTYLCGTFATDGTVIEHGDIGNTEVIFMGQLDRARASGQIKSILLNMGSLLCTIEMEYNGMAVDYELGMEHAAELTAQIAVLSEELAGYLPADLPFEFNWGSAQQKSAIIFGGSVSYQKRMPILDEQGQQAYAQMDVTCLLHNDGTLLHPEDVRLADENWKWANLQTYKGGKNAGEYKTKKAKVNDPNKPKSRMEDFTWDFPGHTKPKPKWRTGTDGQYKTGAEVIAELGSTGIPFLKSLSKITQLSKDLSTYYITTDEKGVSKGMLTLVQPDGIIHHKLNHTSTITARFSSSDPNLQNLSGGSKSKVKQVFVSRFKDGKIIQSDFTALEIYVQAILTRSKQLIADLKAGLDMHCLRVSQKEGISYDEAVRLCITEAIEEWALKRKKAKVFSFRRAYGAGAASIADAAGMSVEDAEELIKGENARYPEIEKYFDALTATIRSNSRPSKKFFVHEDNPAVMCNPRKSYSRTPDNKLYSYEERAAPEYMLKRGTFTSFSPTEIKNYSVQGTGGEWAKAAMWLAIRAYYKRQNFAGLALLVNQVHDALYADAHPDAAFEAAAVLEAAMLAASDFMEWYFSWNVPVPVPSATGWGSNMADEQKMPEGFSERVTAIRQEMRNEYMGCYQPSFEGSDKLAA